MSICDTAVPARTMPASQTTGRQRGVGGRPVGNSSGRNSTTPNSAICPSQVANQAATSSPGSAG